MTCLVDQSYCCFFFEAYAVPDTKLMQKPPSEGTSDTESFEEISESDLMELQAHKSPVSETSDTLTYGSLTSADDNLNENGTADADNGQKYVSEFLEKYVLGKSKNKKVMC